jgi:hypothetical protein
MDTDRSRKYRPLIDRLEMSRFAGLSSPLVIAVGAVGILTQIYLPHANHVLMRTINTQF